MKMSGAGDWLKSAATSKSEKKLPRYVPEESSDDSDGGFDFNPGAGYSGDAFNYDNGFEDDFEPTIVRTEMEEPVQLNPPKVNALRFVIYKGTVEQIKFQLEKLKTEDNFGINDVLDEQWTSLMHACHVGKPDIVKFLMDQGADPSFQNADLLTCLMPLTCSLNENVAEVLECATLILADNRVDINAKEVELGATALHLAVKSNSHDLLKLLIKKGADVDKSDGDDSRPLHWAASRGSGPLIKTLLEAGADVQLLNSGGLLAYEIAALEGYPKTAKVLYHCFKSSESDLSQVDLTPLDEYETSPKACQQHGSNWISRNDVQNTLSQLKLRRYLQLFEKHQVKLSQFLQLRDPDLKEIGIESVGDRMKIMDAIRQMHNHDWKPTSLVSFSPNGLITVPDAAYFLRCVENHLELMNATIKYLTDRSRVPPGNVNLFNTGLENNESGRVKEYCDKLAQATRSLQQSCDSYRCFVSEIKGNVEYNLGDYFE